MTLPYKFNIGYPRGYSFFLGREVLYFGIFVILFNWKDVLYKTKKKIIIFYVYDPSLVFFKMDL